MSSNRCFEKVVDRPPKYLLPIMKKYRYFIILMISNDIRNFIHQMKMCRGYNYQQYFQTLNFTHIFYDYIKKLNIH